MLNNNLNVIVLPNVEKASLRAAELFYSESEKAVTRRKSFAVALSGGSTPKRMLEILSGVEFRAKIDWEKLQIFQSDERYVPADNPNSNTKMLRDTLLNKVPIPESNIHTYPVERAFEESAKLYNDTLVQCLGDPPILDMALLGVGTDGHTASLFPGSDSIDIRDRYAAAVYANVAVSERLTLTLPTIKNAELVVFLVTGESKAEITAECLNNADSELPAAVVSRESKNAVWILDTASATKLSL